MRTLERLFREEDGQALLYGAGAMALLVVLFFGAVDLGQAVLGKIQAQNAADAAALSGAALKAGVHNTRSLAYRAMSGQARLARLQLVRATGLALQELAAPTPPRAFEEALAKAEAHRGKIERLREGLLRFNEWAAGMQGKGGGTPLVRDAAAIGYLGNLGTLAAADATNLGLLDEAALLESKKTLESARAIGGVTYSGEALSAEGAAGKTMVRVSPKGRLSGGGLLGYEPLSPLMAEAAAGPLPMSALGAQTAFETLYGLNGWVTVRLLPIGARPKGAGE